MTQISASVSTATKEQLDQFAERHGLKKTWVVEQALLFYMAARTELPDEAFIPSRIVLEESAFDDVLDAIDNPPRASDELRRLLRDE